MTPSWTTTKDTRAAREDAAHEGREDGRRNIPAALPDGSAAADRHGEARDADARTAAIVHLVDHLTAVRPVTDADLAGTTGEVVRLTGRSAEDRQRYEAALRDSSAFDDEVPVADRDRFWPPWLRVLAIVLMALCGAANLAAGLLGVTSDDPQFAVSYAIAVGAGLVGLGAATGHLLKTWELNRRRRGEHVASRSKVPVGIAVLGLVFAVALAVAVASIRAVANTAEAQRMAQLDDLLDGPITLPGSDTTATVPATEPEDAAPPTIPAAAWGVLEATLVVGALLIEYAGHQPLARHGARLRRTEQRARDAWEATRAELSDQAGDLMATWEVRASQDAAATLAGEAAVQYAAVERAEYRRADIAHRSDAADPFGPETSRPGPGVAEPAPADAVHAVVRQRWGRALRPWPTPGDDDARGLDGVVAEAIEGARAELVTRVERPVAQDRRAFYAAELRHHDDQDDHRSLPRPPAPPASRPVVLEPTAVAPALEGDQPGPERVPVGAGVNGRPAGGRNGTPRGEGGEVRP